MAVGVVGIGMAAWLWNTKARVAPASVAPAALPVASSPVAPPPSAAVAIVDGFIVVPDQLNFVIPPSVLWNTGLYTPAPDVGLWLQSAAYVPGGSFFDFEVSEVIKHEVFESDTPGTFYDNCSSAVNGPGLNDINDLNVPIAFSTVIDPWRMMKTS